MTTHMCSAFCEESTPAKDNQTENKNASSGPSKPNYQTYREALSLISYGLSKDDQIAAFDFLADTYKQAPLALKPIFVMALISSLTRLNYLIEEEIMSTCEGVDDAQ